MAANDPYGTGIVSTPSDPYGTGITASPQPQDASSLSPDTSVSDFYKRLKKTGGTAYQKGLGGLEGYLMGKVIPSAGSAVNATLNAAEGAVAGTIAGKGPLYGATHPDDPSFQREARLRLLTPLVQGGLAAAGLPVSDPGQARAVAETVSKAIPEPLQDFAFRTAIDPLTYGGEPVGKALYKLGDYGVKALWKASPALETLLRPNALVRSRLSASEAAKYEGIVDREKMLDRQIKEEERAAEAAKGKPVPKHEPQVKVKPPGPKWAAPWTRLTPEERLAQPTRRAEQQAASASPSRRAVLRPGAARGGPGTFGLEDARAPVNRNLTRDEIRENRIKDAVNKVGLPYVQNLERDPPGAWQQMNRWLSNLGKDVLFTNSIPHMGNIGFLVWLHGGEGTLARGLAHFSDPKFYRAGSAGPIVEELEEFGGHTHFSKEPRIIGKIPGLGTISRASQGMLDRWEAAMRGAMYESELAKRGLAPLGRLAFRGMSEAERDARFAAAAEARRIADYTNTNAVTRFLTDNLGAPFAQWKGLAMPSSVVRGTLAHPQRAARIARAGNVVNQDVVPQNRPELESGKPTEEAWKLFTQPGKYAASESLMGPVVGPLMNAALYHQTMPEMLSETAQGYLPFAGTTQAALGLNPFHQPGGRLSRGLESLIGVHGRKRPGHKLALPMAAAASPLDPYGTGIK